jgi:predicted aldo/keto reductase-like oxidoreductase
MWEVKTKEDVSRLFHEQLKKLQMDYVDYYLLHALDRERWELTKKLGILDMLEKFRKEGKIRNIGFSFHDEYDVFEDIIRSWDWDFTLIQLNYMDVNVQAGLKGYHLSQELNIPVMIMEPVKGGSLVNFADDVKDIFAECKPEWSLAAWAIRWAASLPGVRLILSGMSTVEQVEDNLNTIENFAPLTDKEYQVLDHAIEVIKTRIKNGCTGCAYCVPCPVGIEIPKCFYAWNQYEMYRSQSILLWDYTYAIEEEKRADKCTECGACEKLCPQGISISEDLKKLSSEFKEYMNA